MTSTAVATRDNTLALATPSRPALLRPIAEPRAIIDAQNEARAMVHEALKAGRDYGVIPGTDKPTMLKPGAERVALGFGCYYGTPEIVESEIDHDREIPWLKTKWVTTAKPENHADLKTRGLGRNRQFEGKWVWQERQDERGVSLGLYRYVIRVPVVERASGAVVGSGVGSCSTMESKYIDRPRDCENTVLKMAYKRAMVAACLTTFGLSDEFTQDIEEQHPSRNADDDGASSAPSHATSEPEARCPVCRGGMWDNREKKANPKSPDFKCKDKACDGVYWPGQWPPAPEATAEQKARILELVAVANVKEDARLKTVAIVNDATKPLTAKRACEIIDKLTAKIAEPADQSQIDFSKEDEQRSDPTSSRTPTQSGSTPSRMTGATSGTTTATSSALAPGNVEDALDKPSQLSDLTKRITTLLMHDKFDDADRRAFRKRMDAAATADEMQKLVQDLEATIAAPF